MNNCPALACRPNMCDDEMLTQKIFVSSSTFDPLLLCVSCRRSYFQAAEVRRLREQLLAEVAEKEDLARVRSALSHSGRSSVPSPFPCCLPERVIAPSVPPSQLGWFVASGSSECSVWNFIHRKGRKGRPLSTVAANRSHRTRRIVPLRPSNGFLSRTKRNRSSFGPRAVSFPLRAPSAQARHLCGTPIPKNALNRCRSRRSSRSAGERWKSCTGGKSACGGTPRNWRNVKPRSVASDARPRRS